MAMPQGMGAKGQKKGCFLFLELFRSRQNEGLDGCFWSLCALGGVGVGILGVYGNLSLRTAVGTIHQWKY